jgi:Fe-Mn family superoxide dismutase
MTHIDRTPVHASHQQALNAASEPLGCAPEDIGDALLLDVRRAAVFRQATDMVAGARWRDPAIVETWSNELQGVRGVVAYCVHGHEVSRTTALRLLSAGINARFLLGGFEHWKAQGKPTQPKSEID